MQRDEYIQKITTLLLDSANSDEGLVMASKIAEKSTLENHLYEDLGLKSREAMSAMMARNYKNLSDKKPKHIRWKKFLYDSIGEVAPACLSCGDKDSCFTCEI